MSVDGTWEVRAHGAGIDETVLVALTSDGHEVSGEVRHGDERFPISGGRLEGDRLTFAMSVSRPMKAKLSAKLTVDGDRMSGTARANLLLTVRLDAIRVSTAGV